MRAYSITSAAGTILQVTRRDKSVVQVEQASDPFERLLEDARQVVGNDKGPTPVPAEIAAHIVPGILRTALESVCNDLTRRRLLGSGMASADVEARLASAYRLVARISLAVHGEVRNDPAVRSWMSQKGLEWAIPLVRSLNSGAHGAASGDLTGMLDDTRRLGRRLREVLA